MQPAIQQHSPTSNILIIDDDEVDRHSIIRALKKGASTYHISEAATGRDGIKLAKDKHFDIVLLDYRLPDSNGLNILHKLRGYIAKNAAIIMISQYEDESLIDLVIDAGAQDLILKSDVTSRRLSQALRQAKHRSEMESALRLSHERMRKLAECDALTGLANRYTFERTLQSAVSRVSRTQAHLAVMLLDLDKFKNINDSMGHEAGDQLLIEVSRRLRLAVRDSDFLARLGGDEFVVIIQDMDRESQASILAERILSAFKPSLIINHAEIKISCSIGIAIYNNFTVDGSELLKFADIAMYRAKQEGRSQYHFYSRELHDTVRQRIKLESDLDDAIRKKQFELYYQAQLDIKTNELRGAEALLRWNHPTKGTLLPEEFIDIAEETGKINDIGAWVLQQTCQQIQTWSSHDKTKQIDFTVAINLSAIQLKKEDFLRSAIKILNHYSFPPHLLEIEVTENSLIDQPDKVANILKSLNKKGVNLALDDFGTGYSSFQHLQMFPIHALKIDRSFIATIENNPTAQQLLKAMIQFGKALNLTVICEGIETDFQNEFCAESGCDLCQGFFHAKPMDVNNFEVSYLQRKN